jgi:hypothetical protein
MKNKIILQALVVCTLGLSGCVSTGTGQRVLFDSLGTGAGGAAAYFASDGDPALTTAGAVSGFVVTEALQAMARATQRKSDRQLIKEGIAIGQERILKRLHEESNGLPRNPTTYTQPLIIPERTQNGVKYDIHEVPLYSPYPEKLLIPGMGKSGLYKPHYERAQEVR